MRELPELAQAGIKSLLKSFELLHSQQRAMYRKLQKCTKENELTKRLQTKPSIGPATAAAFLFSGSSKPGDFHPEFLTESDAASGTA